MKIPSLIRARLCMFPWKWALAAFYVALQVVVLFQYLGGVYVSELGGHPDEPAHYVTGLMIRDYLASGFHSGPMTYAKDYYDHYPKVALGNWPPFFYVIQSAWTLPFSPSHASVLRLMAVLAALLAVLLFLALKKEFGPAKAAFGTILFLALPLVQQHSGYVMTEIPVALLSLLAALCFARFLEREETLDSLLFGLFAALAILTKGSGLMLALVPPLALLFSRKFHLLKKPSFWYPALIVLVLCGPWTWKFREEARAGWMEGDPSWHFTKQALVYYPWKLVLAVGIGLALMAVIGLAAKLFSGAKPNPPPALWSAAGALLFAVLFMHLLVPCGLEPRHLVPALPALVMFIIAGTDCLAQWLQRTGQSPRSSATLAYGLVAALFLTGAFTVKPKGYSGFSLAAQDILNDPANAKAVMLISSDATGEGIFISEIAVREKRPGHTVRRASKVLASSSWSGGGYQAKYENETDLMKFLEKEPLRLLVLDESIPNDRRVAHHDLLRRTVTDNPARFTLLKTYPVTRGGFPQSQNIQVFRFNG